VNESGYVTHTDLEAFEGRILNRIAELELRIERRFNEQTRWIVGIVLPVYALVLATVLTIVVFGFNILSRLP